jgi:hypothetical protein
LPLDISIRKQGDIGIPSALSSKEEKIGRCYRDVAQAVVDQLGKTQDSSGPEIVFE